MTKSTPAIPITIVTGFLGSGKTTLLLNLIPQLPPNYRLALLKNEFGDVAVDSQLASTQSISGVRELLNGCICCNLVGQLGDALNQLRDQVRPDRIVIETSGSAFPATLAMEVNRLSREESGGFVLDGVISVVDVENWQGYEDTSYTAKMQAKYTDLVIFNKWELVPEQRFDICLDRLGDLELDPPTPWVKSDKGWVDKSVLLGIDGALLSREKDNMLSIDGQHNGHGHEHDHQSEVEVLSATFTAPSSSSTTTTKEQSTINLSRLEQLLQTASKEEVYRIKGVIRYAAGQVPAGSDPALPTQSHDSSEQTLYILNWAFGRWTFTPAPTVAAVEESESPDVARLTFILARHESAKWTKKLESTGLISVAEGNTGELTVQRLL